jgi:acetyl-CoA/propionyl-CoA carboxylase, biotin carboxylase, biotin carboxyl carrier protein
MVTGLDLVLEQIAIAEGRPLGFSQSDVSLTGHAVEARLYAEDPWHDFLPATGEVLAVSWPRGEGVRVDVGIGQGDVVGTRYDPLLAKLIVRAESRREAMGRLSDALESSSVIGVTNNRGFLSWLVTQPAVARGQTFTPFIDEEWDPLTELSDGDWRAVTSVVAQALGNGTLPIGFRLNAPPRIRVQIGNEVRSMAIPEDEIEHPFFVRASAESVVIDLDGSAIEARLAPAPTVEAAIREASHAGSTSQSIAAPMPGNVLAVRVKEGDAVEAGQVLVVLEAMKMENNVPAPAAGHVARVLVAPGQQVQRAETLVELA